MTKQQTHEPRPATHSEQGGKSADAAAQQRGEPANSLAGARMPATSTEEKLLAPAERANAAALEPDYATAEPKDDPELAETSAAPDDGRPANFTRRPFGSQLPKLEYPQRRGYRRYWFNDKPGRVARAKEAGYSNVIEDGQPVVRTVSAGGVKAYLMEIPEHWFREDMRAQQRQIDEIERAIRAGDMKRNDGDNRYVPKDAIKFRDE